MSLRSWFYAPPSAPTCSRTQKLNFTIGKHFRDKYSLVPRDLTKNFSVIKKCTNEFDCLHYEMFFIQELRRALNVRSVSIGARFLILIKFLVLILILIWFLIGFYSFPPFVCSYCPFTLLKNFILLNTHAYIFLVKFLLLN